MADDLGEGCVDDGGELVALEVRADELVGFDAENALESAFAGGLESGVDGLGVSGFLADEGEVDDGDVGGGDTDGEAVELAGGLRDDQLEGCLLYTSRCV